MSLLRISLVLFLCGRALAQLPVIPYYNPPVSAAADPFSSVTYRWVSSDLGSNATVTGNWVDRIVGSNWWMTAGANQPTNTGSTNGVWFDATHWLTNNGLPISSNVSFGFIIKIIDDGRVNLDTFPAFLSTTTNGTVCTMFSTDFRDGFGQDYPLWHVLRRNPGTFPYNNSSKPLTNVWTDIIFTQAVTNNSTLVGSTTAYTNGVQGVRYDAVTLAPSWGGYDASAPLSGPTNNFPQFLMFNPNNKTSIKGFIRELWVWGNYTNSLLYSGSVSNFHWWRTNTYGP
jgi:hypothetical protein